MIVKELDANSVGVIVRQMTGIAYTAQVAGMLCYHPRAEGLFVPLPRFDSNLYPTAFDEFHNYVCCMAPNLPEITRAATIDEADHISQTFKKHKYPFTVDLAALEELTEAWIPIVVDQQTPYPFDMLKPYVGMRAILTYPNCD